MRCRPAASVRILLTSVGVLAIPLGGCPGPEALPAGTQRTRTSSITVENPVYADLLAQLEADLVADGASATPGG